MNSKFFLKTLFVEGSIVRHFLLVSEFPGAFRSCPIQDCRSWTSRPTLFRGQKFWIRTRFLRWVYPPPVNWKWLGHFDWFIFRLDKDKIRKIVLCQKKLKAIEKMGRSGKSSKSGSEIEGPTMSDSMSTSKISSQMQR